MPTQRRSPTAGSTPATSATSTTTASCILVDRAKDMIIRAGENVYCVEIENVLFEHPDVIDAAVVGVPHQTLGEEVKAVVQLRPGSTTTAEDIRAFCREHLANFKVPEYVELRASRCRATRRARC